METAAMLATGWYIGILACGVVGGGLPFVLRRSRNTNAMLEFGVAFGAGVFTGAGFIHLLPESAEDLDEEAGYPLAGLLASLSCLIMITMEELTKKRCGGSLGRGAEATTLLRDQRSSPSEATKNERHEQSLGIFAPALMFGALSFHSLVEGLALGSTSPNGDAQDSILIAIFAHKSVAAFALGSNLAEARKRNGELALGTPAAVITILVFSAVTPVAAAIAEASVGDSHGMASHVLTAFAAGTFIYLGLIEGAAQHLRPPTGTFGKFTAFVLGYAVMAVLAVWV